MESLTVFITVLSGVITFVVGQLAVKLILDPVQDLKKTIGQISHTLVDRANVIANPDVSTKEEKNETSVLLRKLSAHLHAHLYLVPWYVTDLPNLSHPIEGEATFRIEEPYWAIQRYLQCQSDQGRRVERQANRSHLRFAKHLPCRGVKVAKGPQVMPNHSCQ